VKTTMDIGQIMSVEGDGNRVTRYLVKFPFGIGYVQPNAILEVLPSSSDDSTLSTETYQPPSVQDMQVMFVTKSMYIALRLYICLRTSLSQLSNLIPGYNALIELATKKDTTDYETQCRKVAGGASNIHVFLNIPLFVKRCAEAFSQMADEEDFVQLSHLSQLQLRVRLNVVFDAILERSDTNSFRFIPFHHRILTFFAHSH
jgi:hypothetical protein